MPIGNLDVPIIGKNVVIAVLVQSHILFATFIIGAVLIAATSEYLGMVTKQNNYERFARNLARFVVLLFASGAALAITFVLALVTLFPVFFSILQNIFFWVFLVGGMCAGAAGLHHAHVPALMAFILPAALPFVVLYLLEGTERGLGAAAMILVFLGAVSASAWSMACSSDSAWPAAHADANACSPSAARPCR